MLGAGDADGAHAAATRMIWWSVAIGSGLRGDTRCRSPMRCPRAFTSDPRVLHQAALLWPFLVAMQPLGGAVFALDGILIGAGDTRYLMWSMLAASAVFIALASLALALGWGDDRRVGRPRRAHRRAPRAPLAATSRAGSGQSSAGAGSGRHAPMLRLTPLLLVLGLCACGSSGVFVSSRSVVVNAPGTGERSVFFTSGPNAAKCDVSFNTPHIGTYADCVQPGTY